MLKHAPPQQAVSEPTILHTTLARLLKPPEAAGGFSGSRTANSAKGVQLEIGVQRVDDQPAAALAAVMEAMTQQLCGLQASMHELW